MTSFMQEPLADAGRRAPHWMQSLQARGLSLWEHVQLPTTRQENWKYTNLGALREDYSATNPDSLVLDALPLEVDADFGGSRLVFVDGVYQSALSTPPVTEGCELVRFNEADDVQSAKISAQLNASLDAEEHVFAALNTAALQDGVFVDIAANAHITDPIHVLWLTRAEGTPTAINQRLLVTLGQSAQATIVEQFVTLDGSEASFCNGLSELFLNANSQLSYYRLHEEQGSAVHVGGVHARLRRDARLSSFHLALGSELKRLDIVVQYDEPGAHADLNGVYLPRGKEHIDYHTTIEHAVPNCTTDEVFRGIIADQATAVFNGRIHIHPQAQKTHAKLSNRNLLTSKEATINTKPELEIYADDVQCAHGATVAQLDELALHYLRTRGVSRAEAEVMLSFGFINELIEAVALEPLREYLRPLLASRFARDSDLARHLLP